MHRRDASAPPRSENEQKQSQMTAEMTCYARICLALHHHRPHYSAEPHSLLCSRMLPEPTTLANAGVLGGADKRQRVVSKAANLGHSVIATVMAAASERLEGTVLPSPPHSPPRGAVSACSSSSPSRKTSTATMMLLAPLSPVRNSPPARPWTDQSTLGRAHTTQQRQRWLLHRDDMLLTSHTYDQAPESTELQSGTRPIECQLNANVFDIICQ